MGNSLIPVRGMQYRYYPAEGESVDHEISPSYIMGQLADLFLHTNDPSLALNQLFRQGIADGQGKRIVLGINDLLGQIKGYKRGLLMRYDAGGVFDKHWQRFFHILDREFTTIRDLLNQIEGLDFKEIEKRGRLKTILERLLGPLTETNWSEKLERLRRIEATLRSHLQPQKARRLTSFLKKYESHPWTDETLSQEMAKLLLSLPSLVGLEDFLDRQRFRGSTPLDYPAAVKLQEIFHRLESLEGLLRKIDHPSLLEELDLAEIEDLLGEEASRALRQLRRITRLLEEAGFVAYSEDGIELTPKGIKEIGKKVLQDIFASLNPDRRGQHSSNFKGGDSAYLEESRSYQFGDPFILDLHKTLQNTLLRQAREQTHTLPLQLAPEDFEVHQSYHLTRTSTVLMLDMSWSMTWASRFLAAKKVAIALYNLIRAQYPHDNLYIVGFYSSAKEISPEELPYLDIHNGSFGTNMQAGLRVAMRLLARDNCHNKRIIIITDGEPTAHFDQGELFFQYPPAPETLHQTLLEVKRCTQKGIILTIFMLNDDHYLLDFVHKISQINKGQVFHTTPEQLGSYIFLDYMNRRFKRIA